MIPKYFVPFQCDILFLPCGHVCCCWKCESSLTGCPLCRADVTTKVKLQTANWWKPGTTKSYSMTRHFATINDKIWWVMDNFRKRRTFLKPELKSVLPSAILSSSIKTSGEELVNFWSWLHICPSVMYTISVRKTGLRIWFWPGACVRALWVGFVFVLCSC